MRETKKKFNLQIVIEHKDTWILTIALDYVAHEKLRYFGFDYG